MKVKEKISAPLWIRKDKKLLKAFCLGVLKGWGRCNNLPEDLSTEEKHNLLKHTFIINSCGSLHTRKNVVKIAKGNFDNIVGFNEKVEEAFKTGKCRG